MLRANKAVQRALALSVISFLAVPSWAADPATAIKEIREAFNIASAVKEAKAVEESSRAVKLDRAIETAPKADVAATKEIRSLSQQIDATARGPFQRLSREQQQTQQTVTKVTKETPPSPPVPPAPVAASSAPAGATMVPGANALSGGRQKIKAALADPNLTPQAEGQLFGALRKTDDKISLNKTLQKRAQTTAKVEKADVQNQKTYQAKQDVQEQLLQDKADQQRAASQRRSMSEARSQQNVNPQKPQQRLAWNDMSDMLRQAARRAAPGKEFFGIGAASRADADVMGKAWVGRDYKVASDGKILVSRDELRQYRSPSYKPDLGKVQANFEQRSTGLSKWQQNANLDIID